MSFKPQKIESPLSKTRSGQKVISKIKSSTFLPGVFQSSLTNRWLDATLDLMISKGDLEDINSFVGLASGQELTTLSDLYLNTNNLQHMQPTVFGKLEDGSFEGHMSWDNVTDKVYQEFKNYNYNAAYSSRSYVFNPPINTDKFINFNQYYWTPSIPAARIPRNDPAFTNVNPVTDLTGKAGGDISYLREGVNFGLECFSVF